MNRDQIIKNAQTILQRCVELLEKLKKQQIAMNEQTQNSKKIYEVAKHLLGIHLSGDNAEYGCAISVNQVFIRALGRPVGGGASTSLMYDALRDTNRFIKVETPLAGDVIISPTGYGNGRMPNGHVGICGEKSVMSNNSEDGKWHAYYTIDTWRALYEKVGGFPIYYFRVL